MTRFAWWGRLTVAIGTLCSTATLADSTRVTDSAIGPTFASTGQSMLPGNQQKQFAPSASTTQLPPAFLADIADGRVDRASLVAASALVAEEQHPATLQALERRRLRLENELRDWAGPDHSLPQRIEIVHRFLHERVLTGEYREDRNEPALTLFDGHFNCLTASLLFVSFAKTLDVPAVAVASRTHVFCRVPDREPWDVETTDPDWRPQPGFRAAKSRERSELDAAPQPLNDAELLAKISYNRGVAANVRGDTDGALREFRRALQISAKDTAARDNLAAVLGNAALAAADEGRFDLALRHLTLGLAEHPRHAALAANDLHIHQRYAQRLCDAGEFQQAFELLQAGHQRRPDAPLFDRGRVAIFQQWILTLARQGSRQEALAVAEQAIQTLPNDPSLRQLRDDLTTGRM